MQQLLLYCRAGEGKAKRRGLGKVLQRRDGVFCVEFEAAGGAGAVWDVRVLGSRPELEDTAAWGPDAFPVRAEPPYKLP